jgi:hypothetical protein
MTQDYNLVSPQSSACLKPGSPLDPRPRPAEPGDTIDFRSNGSSHPTAPSYPLGHPLVAPASWMLSAKRSSGHQFSCGALSRFPAAPSVPEPSQLRRSPAHRPSPIFPLNPGVLCPAADHHQTRVVPHLSREPKFFSAPQFFNKTMNP